jgi:alpha-1,3-mannosyltransferase
MRSVTALYPASRDLFGLKVLSCGPDEACDLIESRMLLRVPTRVAFVNANLALFALERPNVRKTLGKFLLLNDGVGVDIANRILNGSGFPANLNGTDFIPRLLNRVRMPLRIFLLGATQATVETAARVIASHCPRHAIVGRASGYFGSDQEDAVAKTIAWSRAHLVLVAMGNPKQEDWIARHIPYCAPCAIGVGALFDFLAGNVPRAPRWIRTLRLEWLFRLSREPRRLWRRYLIGNTKFLAYVLSERFERSASHFRTSLAGLLGRTTNAPAAGLATTARRPVGQRARARSVRTRSPATGLRRTDAR